MDYKTPGVYIEEIPKLPPSIAQVETAIPAFIGYTNISPFVCASRRKRIDYPAFVQHMPLYDQIVQSSSFTMGLASITPEELSSDVDEWI